jgi:hypothetical protein
VSKVRNQPSYHEDSDGEYDETPPEAWSKGLVGFKPAPVVDLFQTEPEPIPDHNADATGVADGRPTRFLETRRPARLCELYDAQIPGPRL